MARTYEWQRYYESVIFETDMARLPQLIATAEAAIEGRRAELHATGEDGEERQAIDAALAGLNLLRDRFNRKKPDQKSG
jgi:hypothetical protein